MRRGLQESLEYALSVIPELFSEIDFSKRFTPMISKCVLAANQIRLGQKSERDLATLIYGTDDVPASTLRRLVARTQQALETITTKASPGRTAPRNAYDEFSFHGVWMSLMSMYASGVDAYFLRQPYRAQERLSSVMTTARDPYMLPISLSSGLFLSFHLAQQKKHSRLKQTIATMKKNFDSLNDCWDWMMTYIELQSFMRRRYRIAANTPRINEISQRLDDLLNGPVEELSPQAQMIAATCAYIVNQNANEPEATIRWADIYKRASLAVNRHSPIYSRESDRMYLSVYMATKQYARAIPLLEKMVSRELASAKADKRPADLTFHVWLADALLWERRYSEVIKLVDGIRSSYVSATYDFLRFRIMIQRSMAVALVVESQAAVDRRVSRIAMRRNESSDRRAGDNLLRIQALVATLIGSVLQEGASRFTTTDVIERLMFIHKNSPDLRSCKRTSAFVRLVAMFENFDRTKNFTARRLRECGKMLEVLETNFNFSSYEIISYLEIARRLYPNHIQRIRPSLLASGAIAALSRRALRTRNDPQK